MSFDSCWFVRPRLRNAGRSLPKSHSRGLQSEWWRGRADSDGLRNPWIPLHRVPAFPYRPAVTRLTQSLSFDSALLSRGAPFGARCVPTSSSHSTAPEPARAKRCAMRIPARHGILWPGFRNTWRTANPARDAEIIYQLFRGRNYFSRWRLASKPRCLDSNFPFVLSVDAKRRSRRMNPHGRFDFAASRPLRSARTEYS